MLGTRAADRVAGGPANAFLVALALLAVKKLVGALLRVVRMLVTHAVRVRAPGFGECGDERREIPQRIWVPGAARSQGFLNERTLDGDPIDIDRGRLVVNASAEVALFLQRRPGRKQRRIEHEPVGARRGDLVPPKRFIYAFHAVVEVERLGDESNPARRVVALAVEGAGHTQDPSTIGRDLGVAFEPVLLG